MDCAWARGEVASPRQSKEDRRVMVGCLIVLVEVLKVSGTVVAQTSKHGLLTSSLCLCFKRCVRFLTANPLVG